MTKGSSAERGVGVEGNILPTAFAVAERYRDALAFENVTSWMPEPVLDGDSRVEYMVRYGSPFINDSTPTLTVLTRTTKITREQVQRLSPYSPAGPGQGDYGPLFIVMGSGDVYVHGRDRPSKIESPWPHSPLSLKKLSPEEAEIFTASLWGAMHIAEQEQWLDDLRVASLRRRPSWSKRLLARLSFTH